MHLDVTARSDNGVEQTRIVLLSSSLLTDRMFLYTNFLNVLSERCDVTVWAASRRSLQLQQTWQDAPVVVEEFPEIGSFREFPHNYFRRLNEFIWDYRHQAPSRLSMMRHIRDRNYSTPVRALKLPARALAMLRTERIVENRLERLLLSYPRSREAHERLLAERPSMILTTGPFQFEQPAVVAAAMNLDIPTLAMIPSWDNLSTKNRMVFKYDGYMVWSEQRKEELHHYYPYTKDTPVYVIGAPQFDVFFQERFHQTREEFCEKSGLRPDRPIIVYAVGSPNFLKEHHGALYLAKKIAAGELGDVQMIVRPHPIHDRGEMRDLFAPFFPRVVLQHTSEVDIPLPERTQDVNQIVEWVNTFRHANVVVNLSSTVTVDAAIFDCPVVNLDFDPEPGQKNQELIKDINHVWTHFKPVAESEGVWLVNDYDEMVEAVRTYLAHPELHREKRRWIAEYVCGYLDGQGGERMASAIMDFVCNHTKGKGVR